LEVALYHPFGAQNFEGVPRFLENLGTHFLKSEILCVMRYGFVLGLLVVNSLDVTKGVMVCNIYNDEALLQQWFSYSAVIKQAYMLCAYFMCVTHQD
jgi:hypothetical protein